ncbi:hypothetical protein Btru_027574 [Bulinus truncatus]|nr:hypothetical protein Btru_027574 [Bulinus truncatus]
MSANISQQQHQCQPTSHNSNINVSQHLTTATSMSANISQQQHQYSEQIPRSNRLSSLISTLRRGSTASRRNTLTSLYDVNPEPISPVSCGLQRKKKQKSLFRLLRSTRQSNAQSVIHRNGDVIIMKSGKIVSVRRGVQGRESSPFIDRLLRFKEETDAVNGLAAGLANPSKVLLGIMCDGPGGGGEDKKDTDSGSDWSDEVFCGPGSTEVKKKRLNGVSSQPYGEAARPEGAKQNGIVKSTSLQNLDAKVTRVIDMLVPDTDVLNVRLKNGKEHISQQGIKPDNELCSEPRRGSEAASSEKLTEEKTTSIIPTLFINISDDSEMLTVMPLTPNTRQYFTKSDHSLDKSHIQTITESAKHHLNTTNLSKTSQQSRSSENIMRRKRPPIMRLPSVEYLDPPVTIFRSRSHQQMKAIAENEPSDHQPGTTERRTHSKTPFFQSLSPFSRRKLAPDQSTHI